MTVYSPVLGVFQSDFAPGLILPIVASSAALVRSRRCPRRDKKRYAGLSFGSAEEKGKLDFKAGGVFTEAPKGRTISNGVENGTVLPVGAGSPRLGVRVPQTKTWLLLQGFLRRRSLALGELFNPLRVNFEGRFHFPSLAHFEECASFPHRFRLTARPDPSARPP